MRKIHGFRGYAGYSLRVTIHHFNLHNVCVKASIDWPIKDNAAVTEQLSIFQADAWMRHARRNEATHAMLVHFLVKPNFGNARNLQGLHR